MPQHVAQVLIGDAGFLGGAGHRRRQAWRWHRPAKVLRVIDIDAARPQVVVGAVVDRRHDLEQHRAERLEYLLPHIAAEHRLAQRFHQRLGEHLGKSRIGHVGDWIVLEQDRHPPGQRPQLEIALLFQPSPALVDGDFLVQTLVSHQGHRFEPDIDAGGAATDLQQAKTAVELTLHRFGDLCANLMPPSQQGFCRLLRALALGRIGTRTDTGFDEISDFGDGGIHAGGEIGRKLLRQTADQRWITCRH